MRDLPGSLSTPYRAWTYAGVYQGVGAGIIEAINQGPTISTGGNGASSFLNGFQINISNAVKTGPEFSPRAFAVNIWRRVA